MAEIFERDNKQNFYDILEIRTDAPHHEIVKAYQKSKMAYSPDSPALYTMFTQEEAQEIRKLIEEAFLVLGNETKRREYDQILLARKNASNKSAEALPDFGPIVESPVVQDSNRKVVPAEIKVNATTIPNGFAKSKLSVYEVNPTFEKEILEQVKFDGEFIRKIRSYKNINLDQLSKETRIGRSYIVALEANDYEALPAPVFVRGFIVQIARVMGLDETKVAASYMEILRTQAPQQ
jgi:curved DNA-binding protein CbpA